jgi:23S rRNA G2445 N2-methylase RlmL
LADYKSIEWVICCNPPYGVRLMNDERVAWGTQESDLSVLAIHQKLISLLEWQVCRGWFISGFERVSDYKWIEGISQVFVEKQRKGKWMKNGSLDCMWWKV